MADHMIQVAAESPVSPCVFVKELNNINLLLNLTHFTLAGLLAQIPFCLYPVLLHNDPLHCVCHPGDTKYVADEEFGPPLSSLSVG